ncbi:hypothetical protein CIW52_02135 [Mycolicibacterium sp. P9-64]|uniref:hypothetical protein n=1 Tax=Mycolicibacterium sp. P9-64 TaxID=2024612 RepID=UPI0011EF3167|nr:hypothetical protein [Mycolicibacterium sp. P9-64]KAA0086731.1 hypothetical protein CIW52_02135 [Mycolicibacterium sp. P9-64]
MFASDGLDRMCRGTIELSVPLRDDVIQVAARSDDDTAIGRIRVVKGWETVAVVLVDGKPIQVDITVDSSTCTTRARVFHEPVGELRFRRTFDSAGQPRWCAEGPDVLFVDEQRVKQFADTIATFAVRKQDAAQLAVPIAV